MDLSEKCIAKYGKCWEDELVINSFLLHFV